MACQVAGRARVMTEYTQAPTEHTRSCDASEVPTSYLVAVVSHTSGCRHVSWRVTLGVRCPMAVTLDRMLCVVRKGG